MRIRKAEEKDLVRIMQLGREFGHLMYYQKDESMMRLMIPEIIVAEDRVPNMVPVFGPEGERQQGTKLDIVGYYHYVSTDFPGWDSLMEHFKQIPHHKVLEADLISTYGSFACLMQGGSHREIFTELIQYLQKDFDVLWCYCSVNSRRPETYEKLGFNFRESFTFWNVNKGDFSTYRLGEWSALSCVGCSSKIDTRDKSIVQFMETGQLLCGKCQDVPD